MSIQVRLIPRLHGSGSKVLRIKSVADQNVLEHPPVYIVADQKCSDHPPIYTVADRIENVYCACAPKARQMSATLVT